MPSIRQLLAFAASSLPIIAAVGSGPPKKQAFDWDSTRYFLAFGDSYTYVQGTHGRQNYSFIGDQLNFEFDAQTLLSNKIVQNQTATAEGGPNWVEFITKCAVEKGLTSPRSCKKQLWDFAFAGADISVEHLPLHHNFTISLVNQITQYKDYAHPVLQHIIQPRKTLLAIWIGINDINDSVKNTSITSSPTFYNTLMTTLFASVQSTLYPLGYRSYLFLNLPPLDRTPGNQKRAAPAPNATQVEWFNEALAHHANVFEKKNKDTNVLVFDAHRALSDMMDRPGEYGIANTTGFCAGYDQPDIEWNYKAYGCPVPLSEYFWFNSGHLTSAVHEKLAGKLKETLRGWRG